MKETALYPAVKALLVAQGYEVKAEIGAADVVAIKGDDDPVIVELKTGFALTSVSSGDHPPVAYGFGLYRGAASDRQTVSTRPEGKQGIVPSAGTGVDHGPAQR
ncbi:hypothetical protein MUB49_05765 [Phaeobacter sp. J2-8]|nr:hypothetical protein [Phaeobacter sp. J2-8]MCJ7871929.1 hypothetical protein [Phaeobacter sp. J2-8]